MKNITKLIYLFFVVMTVTASTAAADSLNTSRLGFKFGMSNGDAKKQIKNNGHKIVKNEMDSKEVRTIIFEGAVVEFTDVKGADQKTRLEFYKNKLMSAAVMIKSSDDLEFVDIQNEMLKQIVSKYGEPTATDKMFSYDTWEWDIDHLDLMFSTNRDKGKLKLEYTYNPVATTKVEAELDLKRRGEVRSPADQMFKDGNYSQQGGPGARTF